MIRAALLILILALAGCATSGVGLVKPSLPPLPSELALPCKDPGVTVGKTVLGEFARNRQALAACARKQAGTVAFYNDVRSRLRGK